MNWLLRARMDEGGTSQPIVVSGFVHQDKAMSEDEGRDAVRVADIYSSWSLVIEYLVQLNKGQVEHRVRMPYECTGVIALLSAMRHNFD